MNTSLVTPYEVIYYDHDTRKIYWPSDTDSMRLAKKLRQAKAEGLTARLAQVAGRLKC